MLACELGLLGIRATVLEKLPSPTGLSKALGLQSRTMEMLDHRGLLERFSAERSAPPFANFAMFQLNLHTIPFGHPYGVVIPQSDVEQLLEARARELGFEILRGHEITGVHQEEDLVRVGIVGPNGAYEERCHYLVGCDGGHSAVRTLSGIGFPGLGPTVVARFADVKVSEEAKPLLKHAVPELHDQNFGIARTETGNFAIVPLGSGITRVAAVEWDQAQVDRDVPMTLDELQEALLRVIGTKTQAARRSDTVTEACCLLATLRMCTLPTAEWDFRPACRMRGTSVGSWPRRFMAGRRPAFWIPTTRSDSRSASASSWQREQRPRSQGPANTLRRSESL
jgi:2-polyprenyl-6-methoxyphenol hydroxylase-like FAD-dependent oxidoreductase